MKEKFINSSLSFIGKYENIDDLKLLKLKYGLEGIYNLLIKLIIVIIISLIFNTVKETCLIVLFYAGIRTFSYGLHAKNSFACWLITIGIYNVIPYLIKSLNINYIAGYVILIITLISIILFAPADTPKRPLIRKENRQKCKILSILIICIYILLYAIIPNVLVRNSIIYASIIQTIFINPITYKITNTPFNNYKNYLKKD